MSQARRGCCRESVCVFPGVASPPLGGDWNPALPGNASIHPGGLNPKDREDPVAGNPSLNTSWSPAVLGSGPFSEVGVLRWSQTCCLTPVWLRREPVVSCCLGLRSGVWRCLPRCPDLLALRPVRQWPDLRTQTGKTSRWRLLRCQWEHRATCPEPPPQGRLHLLPEERGSRPVGWTKKRRKTWVRHSAVLCSACASGLSYDPGL